MIGGPRATLPDVAKISNGKYDKVTHFQEKVRVQEYMKKIDLPACFVSPSCTSILLVVIDDTLIELTGARSQTSSRILSTFTTFLKKTAKSLRKCLEPSSFILSLTRESD